MDRFIEINDTVISSKDIRRVEFISDDIHLGLIPIDTKGNYKVDYVPFTFAKVITFDNKEFPLSLDLHRLDPGENENEWCKRNLGYIYESMEQINTVLKPFVITGREYSD